LKDHVGVMEGFTRMIETHPSLKAELILVGPNVTAIADDPEGAVVFNEIVEAWRALPHEHRRRVHLAMLPTKDVEENAAIVNAIQRHASVVVQKSLHEGFGLTVTEAMWKGKAVLGSAVGGIQDQIQDRVNGRLLKDPTNLDEFAEILTELLCDPEGAKAMGQEARETVREKYLGTRHISEYTQLYSRMNGCED
jgi:trehalose synthase